MNEKMRHKCIIKQKGGRVFPEGGEQSRRVFTWALADTSGAWPVFVSVDRGAIGCGLFG